jgi:hypothetical protein
VGNNEYEGEMQVHIGPIAGVFSGRLVVSEEVPPESCTLTAEGKGKPGFVNGSGKVRLSEQGQDQTLMTYSGEVQIGGRLAGVGQRMLDRAEHDPGGWMPHAAIKAGRAKPTKAGAYAAAGSVCGCSSQRHGCRILSSPVL